MRGLSQMKIRYLKARTYSLLLGHLWLLARLLRKISKNRKVCTQAIHSRILKGQGNRDLVSCQMIHRDELKNPLIRKIRKIPSRTDFPKSNKELQFLDKVAYKAPISVIRKLTKLLDKAHTRGNSLSSVVSRGVTTLMDSPVRVPWTLTQT